MLDLKQVRKKSDVKLGSAEDDGFDSRDCVVGTRVFPAIEPLNTTQLELRALAAAAPHTDPGELKNM